MKELKEEGKADIREQREMMLREATMNTGERATGETAKYYMEVREGGESEIGKGDRDRDVDRILGQLQTGNCFWLGSYRNRNWDRKRKGEGELLKKMLGRKCPFC